MRGLTVAILGLGSVLFITMFILKSFSFQARLNIVFGFTVMWLGSAVWLIFLLLKGQEPIPWFEDLDGRDMLYVLVALGGVLASAILLSSMPIVVLIVSGLILFALALATRSILAPIIAHGAYNSFVILQPSFVAASAITVPRFGVQLSGLADQWSDVIFQFILTAQAEEYLKLALAVAFMAQNSLPWLKDRNIAIGLSAVAWAGLHTFLAR